MSLSMINILKWPRLSVWVCVSVCMCVLIWHINQSTGRVGKSKSRPDFDMSSKVSASHSHSPYASRPPHQSPKSCSTFRNCNSNFPSDCNCQRQTGETGRGGVGQRGNWPRINCQLASLPGCPAPPSPHLSFSFRFWFDFDGYVRQDGEQHVWHCIFYCRKQNKSYNIIHSSSPKGIHKKNTHTQMALIRWENKKRIDSIAKKVKMRTGY